jgi:hydroxymethylpyrimidine pyrophosphatase-like HAD family hydrolase
LEIAILAANTSKGKSVLQVAKRLGVKPEEIISFGDSYNDMEMIQYTGLGVAMGNAVPELKQVADFVTLSNHEDGVAVVLEALLGV